MRCVTLATGGQLFHEPSDCLGHFVPLERIGSLDSRELRGLIPPIREEKLGRPNPVGLSDRLIVQTPTLRDREQSAADS